MAGDAPCGTLAVTGATGFVGRALVDAALTEGWRVRALTRRPLADRVEAVDWVEGSLERPDSLQALVAGADAVIHVAAMLKGFGPEEFFAANALGTHRLIEACRVQGVQRLIHVSSFAAREPGLSAYAGSKAAAERLVMDSGLDWTIVRPPAVYGPGDRELLRLFLFARAGFGLTFGASRAAFIHVEDLARALLAALAPATIGLSLEVHDGAPDGHGQAKIYATLGELLGKRVRLLHVPRGLLARCAGLAQRRARWRKTPDILSHDKLNELYHEDWTSSDTRLSELTGWRPRFDLRAGLDATLAAYRAKGWL